MKKLYTFKNGPVFWPTLYMNTRAHRHTQDQLSYTMTTITPHLHSCFHVLMHTFIRRLEQFDGTAVRTSDDNLTVLPTDIDTALLLLISSKKSKHSGIATTTISLVIIIVIYLLFFFYITVSLLLFFFAF